MQRYHYETIYFSYDPYRRRTKIFEASDGDLLILNFDADYKTAVSAVLRKTEYSKFPDIHLLDSTEVVVTGKFIYHGRVEIVLTDPKQIAVVK